MRKLLSIVLAMVLMLTFSVSALAVQGDIENVRQYSSSRVSGCIHNWSNWDILIQTFERDYSLGGCMLFTRQDYRFCRTCSETQIKETSGTKPHNWVTSGNSQKCTNCKQSIVPAK